MFNVGGGELLVILLIALLILGPEKLPDTARKIGKVVGELRRMSQGFQNEIRQAMEVPATGTSPGSTGPTLPALGEVPEASPPSTTASTPASASAVPEQTPVTPPSPSDGPAHPIPPPRTITGQGEGHGPDQGGQQLSA